MARRGQANEPVKLLMTLPGVDVATAEAMLAAWGDPKRFPDGDHAASYLGLVPSTKQSANHCYHGPITKRGNSQARWMLIEAAQHLDKHPGPLGHFFRRLLKKKNRNVAVVAAARKLAMIGWRMLTTDEPYRYAIPRTTADQVGRAAGEGHRRAAPERLAQGDEMHGEIGRRKPHNQGLGDVCRTEGLPRPEALSPGERRTVSEAGCAEFVAAIGRTQVVPRRTSTSKASAEANHLATAPQDAKATRTPAAVTTSAPQRRGRTSGRVRQASCQSPTLTQRQRGGFRPHRAGEQGDEAPPPAPPTLFPVVPGRKQTTTKKSASTS